MKKRLVLLLFLISFSICFAQDAISIQFYYGVGCPHCARTLSLFEDLGNDYTLNITEKEVNYDISNRQDLFDLYDSFDYDVNKGGVPSILVGENTLIIGELSEEQWRNVFDKCLNNTCPGGVFNYKTIDEISPIEEKDPASQLTLIVLIGAALADSVNPCTIAVMVMLITVALLADGRMRAFISGMLFTLTIFGAYLLMGFGLLHAIESASATNLFYIIVTAMALILSLMEFNAYFRYKPGFFSVEMPVFLRPYVKKIISGATSYPGIVIAALFCSLFLLPCSSGPYLMVLGMLAKAVTAQTFGYLVLYNLVFILPMVAINLIVYFGKATVEEIGDWRNEHIKEIHLFSGVLFFILFLLMLTQIGVL
ncbi:hypothetical protein JXB01_03545 [Candidatus Micrarchaeota archaeon]|nr:hypothetical protein [Candidatus Micrarchaeota archaeon]